MPEPRKAAALGYDRGRDRAPRVLAAGGGQVAENILERAREHGIPIERDPDLLECLAPLRVGAEIPVTAWVAVAEILSFLYARNRGG
jgi:flagellar biosynthesis protein